MRNMPDESAAAAAQLAATAPEVTQVPVAASGSNDELLANSINELKKKDAEYLRLQSEQAREQWENLTRANLQRQQAAESNQAEKTQLLLAQRDATDAKHNSELFQYAESLADRLRIEYPNGYTSQTLPPTTLAEVVRTNQRFQNAAELAGVELHDGGVIPINWNPKDAQPAQQTPHQSPAPEPNTQTFPDGQPYQLTNHPDGTIEVKLATGERFVGDPLTVAQKMAAAHVETKRWAQNIRQQSQMPPANGNTNSTNGEGEVSEFGLWAANEQARAMGFRDREEMLAWGQNINQKVTQQDEFIAAQQLRGVTADFMQRCPDFPNTPQAIDALSTMIAQHNWEATPQNLEAAHAHLVRTRVYAPLSASEQQAALGLPAQQNRMAPPPMIRSSSPEHAQPLDLWTEPLAEQRARIIREQLAGGR